MHLSFPRGQRRLDGSLLYPVVASSLIVWAGAGGDPAKGLAVPCTPVAPATPHGLHDRDTCGRETVSVARPGPDGFIQPPAPARAAFPQSRAGDPLELTATCPPRLLWSWGSECRALSKPLKKIKATGHRGDLWETGEPGAFASQLPTRGGRVKPQRRLQKIWVFIAL